MLIPKVFAACDDFSSAKLPPFSALNLCKSVLLSVLISGKVLLLVAAWPRCVSRFIVLFLFWLRLRRAVAQRFVFGCSETRRHFVARHPSFAVGLEKIVQQSDRFSISAFTDDAGVMMVPRFEVGAVD